jgi:hypothetical protein
MMNGRHCFSKYARSGVYEFGSRIKLSPVRTLATPEPIKDLERDIGPLADDRRADLDQLLLVARQGFPTPVHRPEVALCACQRRPVGSD